MSYLLTSSKRRLFNTFMKCENGAQALII